MALETMGKDVRRLRLGEPGGVQEKPVRIGRHITSTGEFRDGHAAQGKQAERTLGPGDEEPVAVADADDAGGAMVALQPCRAHQHLELDGAVTDRVTG